MATGSRVFVSSTCYDLLDLRAEVEHHLRDMGLAPVLSNRPTSEFEVSGYKDSIETCLVNVRSCDAFVCILSQRYGPSLNDGGYDDLSATHMEYREARAAAKPIWMFVRDRTAGEYSTWSKNRKSGGGHPEFGWVRRGNEKLFDFIDEHKTLVAGSTASNWYDEFQDSVDLKALLSRRLKLFSGPAILQRLLRDGLVPMIRVRVDTKDGREHSDVFHVAFTCHGSPAIAPTFRMDPQGHWMPLTDITPAREVRGSFEFPNRGPTMYGRTLTIRYHTETGHKIEETHSIEPVTDNDVIAKITCIRKHLLEGLPFELT